MKFGSGHLLEGPFTKSEQQVYDEHIEQIKTSDAIGLDYVWLTEHHFSSVPYVPDVDGEYCVCASPFAMACAVAMITKNVRIGSAIKILAMDHPLRTAEDIAMADLLSHGRIDVGVGLGYRKYEFDGLGIDIEEKLERHTEALDIILKAWTEDEFSYEGKYWQFPNLRLVPKTVQKPHPPVWLASRYTPRDVVDFALNGGHKLLSAWQAVDELRASYDMVLEAQAEAGITERMDFGCIRHVYVAESDAEADKVAPDAIEYYLNSTKQFRPVGDHERGQMIFGGPETCVQKIAELQDAAQINTLLSWMNFGDLKQETILRSMKLFAEEVVPAFREDAAEKAAE
jgi:alkanesulfonate monooxygenase SsuD/methylene tetrahydromethanopterin reductase-like flavin-dependent oxidoreductase (luciferase family)